MENHPYCHLIFDSLNQDINEVGFNAYYDLVFDQYPENFKADLIQYGHEFATEVINQKQYRLFDPVVSDCACQIRAIWLCCFLRSIKNIEDLSIKDFVVFGLARLLCESAINVRHEIIGTAALKTKSSYWPESVTKLQNKLVRERFYGEAKALLAKRVLDDLSKWFFALSPQDLILGSFDVDKEKCYSELCSALQNFKPSYSYSHIPLPVMHSFLGLVVVMTLAAHFQVVVSVIFRKIGRNDDGVLCCKNGCISHFRYDKEQKQFQKIATSELILDTGSSYFSDSDALPELIISGHSYANNTFDCDVDPAHFLESISRYLHKDISIVDCIYMTVSTHDIVSNSKNTIEEFPALTDLLEKYINASKGTGLKVSDSVLRVYHKIQENSLIDLRIEDSVFEIAHIYTDVLRHSSACPSHEK